MEDENLEDEVEAVNEEYKIIMDPTYFYPEDHIENPLEDSPISHRFSEF